MANELRRCERCEKLPKMLIPRAEGKICGDCYYDDPGLAETPDSVCVTCGTYHACERCNAVCDCTVDG